LTLLFDFQCIHCRRLHRILPDLLAKAGGQYRLRLCPVPLSSACNPYIPASGIDRFAGSCPLTRYALAVWYTQPEAYEAYWDYLLGSGDEHAAVAPAEAEARARALLGDRFQTAVSDPRIDAYIRKVEELFGRTSNAEKSGVPRLIHGQKWLVPETDQADELLELIRLSL
jgi:protein-disulfide isomerase